jgi:hypothetical protein
MQNSVVGHPLACVLVFAATPLFIPRLRNAVSLKGETYSQILPNPRELISFNANRAASAIAVGSQPASCNALMPFLLAHARQNANTHTRSGNRDSSKIVPVRTVNIFWHPRQRHPPLGRLKLGLCGSTRVEIWMTTRCLA